nr:MAG TPA: hypothetical protein [Caudoviricetes sp.]
MGQARLLSLCKKSLSHWTQRPVGQQTQGK